MTQPTPRPRPAAAGWRGESTLPPVLPVSGSGAAARITRAGSTIACFLLATTTSLAVAGQDVVVISKPGSEGTARLTGEILDYTGEQLTFRHPSGRQEVFAGARVRTIETNWNSACQRADKLRTNGDLGNAISAYRAAFATESRSWAKRRILSSVISCLRDTGQIKAAMTSFRVLYRDDPSTQYFSTIPLAWTPTQPPANFEREADQWLRDSGSPVARLMAASWMLSTSRRGEALAVLERLDGTEPRIAFLARAQRWRGEAGRAAAADVERWVEQVVKMPLEIRAGPWHAVGRGWAQLGRSEDAALAFLRVPIFFPEQRALAAQSLLAAAHEVEKLDQPDAAVPLLHEIVAEHAYSSIAETARQRLTALREADH